ncbi:hypothetical protein CDL15_Pgr008153 [Punica granatum]|uniref:ABC transporter domain-containing protein n=1 Tax=Punica granatum TaxID=22663 RepID=A0A218VU67_PUNGR|nr:hypothetical protein CDL15_Pgr008153 [Punica granatum]
MVSVFNLMKQSSLSWSSPKIGSDHEGESKQYSGHGEDLNTRNGVNVTWEDLRVTVSNIRDAANKSILQGLTGYARTGELLAVMGPSGCGKTTLLNALAGRLSTNVRKTGDILINGQKQALAYGTSAYVTQDETLVTTLTVREAVHYSAQLQLPASMSNTEKRERADETIRKMGLQDAMDTVIGSSWGPVGSSLSSGQKRRVSICLEILTHPKLLFLDEPTSGLDSAASYYVMKRIAGLNQKKDGARRTVVASIHQPSSEVFQLFDSLCLLSCGKTVYFGPTSTANEDVEDGLSVPVEEAIDTLTTLYESSAYYLEVIQQVAKICKQGIVDGHARLKVEQRSNVSFFPQCSVLTRRSSVNMYRDKGYFWFRLVIYFGIALSMGTIYYDVGNTYESIQARGSLIMFISAFFTYMSVGGFPSFAEDMKVFIRERLNGHYGSSAFVVANAISSFPYILLLTILPGGIIYYLPGMHGGIGCFLYFLLLLFSITMAVEGMMMVIASIVPNFLIGIIVATGVQGLMILGAGIFRLQKDIPKPFWRYPVYYIALHRYAYQGFCKNEYVGLEFQAQYSNGGQQIVRGEQVLRDYFQIDPNYSKWGDLWVILGMVVFYRLLFFASIKFDEIVKPKIAALMVVTPKQATQVKSSPATSFNSTESVFGYSN